MIRHLIAFAVLLVSRPVTAATITEVHYVMGTYLRITAAHPAADDARSAARRCFALARRFDELFSRFDPDSELSRLNEGRADAVSVSPEMAALLRRALALRATTGGAFDVGIGALTALWRTTLDWPTTGEIDAARAAHDAISFTFDDTTLLRRPGMLIDLDGIAKGWTVDHCVTELRAAGVQRALVSFGESSLYALGAPPGKHEWEVLVRGVDPDDAWGTLQLRDQALSVSAVFGHGRQIGARHIGHIIDPRSGQPLTEAAVAVVVAASATDAEAFSKALLIRDDVLGLPISAISGALLIRPSGTKRIGRVACTPFAAARQIATTAEPLR